MSVATTIIDGQNVGLRLLGQTSVSVLSLNLNTGDVSSDFVGAHDCEVLKLFALRLFAIVPKSSRAAGALGLLSRLVAVSPADASTLTLTASVTSGVATLVAAVAASPAALILTIPHSITGGIMPGIVTTNASSGGGGGGAGSTFTALSDDALSIGDAVSRIWTTGKVRKADARYEDRMPAVGLVIEQKGPREYVMQVSGVAPQGLYFSGSETTLFVGEEGRLVNRPTDLKYVQTFGFWLTSSTFTLHINPTLLVRGV